MFNSLRLNRPEEARDLLLEYVPELVAKYGDIAATAAAEWYEQVRSGQVDGAYNALTVPSVDSAVVQGSVRYAAGDLFTDSPLQTLALLSGAMQRWVMYSGRQTVARNARHDPSQPRFARVPTGDKTCAFCSLMASRGFVYYTKQTAGLTREYHDECVVEGTLVTGPYADAGYRRYFEGEIVTLITATGNKLTITPNHPVLTDRGWVRAGLLNEGDQLVSTISPDGHLGLRPDEDQVPSRIEDVVRALGMVSTARWESVPGSAEQFHGDGFDAEVNVVSRYDLFRDECHASLLEPCSKLDFEDRPIVCPIHGVREHSFSMSEPLGNGVLPAFCSSVGCLGLPLSLISSHGCGTGETSGTPAAQLQPAFGNPSSNGSSGYSVTGGEFQDALPLQIPFGKVGWRWDAARGWVGVSGSRFDPPELDSITDAADAYAKLGCDLLERLSGLVKLDCLVHKSVGNFAGRVYNLSTREGWYNANGITVSNCDCQIVAEWDRKSAHIDGYDPDKLFAQYQAARQQADGNTAADVAASMRRMFPESYTDGVVTAPMALVN